MATIVLVHGSWHGGWCWKKLLPYLREQHHEIYAPTLTGLGERNHLATNDTNLSTHVMDITNLLFYEDLTEVYLIGHSYGGAVISGVAEKVPNKIKRLVYLDACIPQNNQSIFDIMPGLEAVFKKRTQISQGKDWLVEPFDPKNWGIIKEDDLQWIKSRLSPMPIHTHDEPIDIPNFEKSHISKSYIRCSEFVDTKSFARVAKGDKNWDYHEIKSGHDVMVIHPEQLAKIISSLL